MYFFVFFERKSNIKRTTLLTACMCFILRWNAK